MRWSKFPTASLDLKHTFIYGITKLGDGWWVRFLMVRMMEVLGIL